MVINNKTQQSDFTHHIRQKSLQYITFANLNIFIIFGRNRHENPLY